jgi:hypothetical protein
MKKLAVLLVLVAALCTLLPGCKSDPDKTYTILSKVYYWSQSDWALIEAESTGKLESFDHLFLCG